MYRMAWLFTCCLKISTFVKLSKVRASVYHQINQSPELDALIEDPDLGIIALTRESFKYTDAADKISEAGEKLQCLDAAFQRNQAAQLLTSTIHNSEIASITGLTNTITISVRERSNLESDIVSEYNNSYQDTESILTQDEQ